jgi:phospholipid/cholesterol/gamma-HCH transport system permease protein
MMTRVFSFIGGGVVRIADELGGMALLFWEMVRRSFKGEFDGDEFWRNMYRVGVKSFAVVVVTAVLVGAIMVIQTGQIVSEYGATSLVGWGTGFATLREVGPILIGLMFSGRVGANNTAELGTMKVTEQIDALRALAINPVSYLLVPRFIAIVIMLFCLLIVGDLVALFSASVGAYVMLDVSFQLFYRSFEEGIVMADFLNGVVKGVFFGGMIALVSNYYGFTTSGGAVGVGRSVNNAVVASATGIFVLDFLLTAVLP